MQVQTNSGCINGCVEDNLYTFKGIPYGTANRFLPPKPISWNGILDCTHFGKKSIQSYETWQACIPGQKASEFSEDCLNLNIYTPTLNNKLPVVIDIHGGGFQTGSNQSRSGAQIIKNNHFVYVSVNYRLGALGYLYLERLLGDKYAQSGNLGTLDQLLAFLWIYNNIEAFGGDKEQISVIGASAGAKSAATLLLIPAFRQHCSRILLTSGAVQSIRDTDTAAKVAEKFFRLSGLKSPKELLTLPASQILKIQEKLLNCPGNTCIFGPVSDNITIPSDWIKILSQKNFWNGHAIIGSCRNELAYCTVNAPFFYENAENLAENLFGKNAVYAKRTFEALSKSMPNASDSDKNALWVRILSDYMYRTHADRLCRFLVLGGASVWKYSMEFGGAFHCLDQNMAFDNMSAEEAAFGNTLSSQRQSLASLIYNSYINFFKTGTPDDRRHFWPNWQAEQPYVMYWDIVSKATIEKNNDYLTDFPFSVYKL